jgi:hypothetical protein
VGVSDEELKSKEAAGCCVVSACRRAKLMIIAEADPGPKLHNEAVLSREHIFDIEAASSERKQPPPPTRSA